MPLEAGEKLGPYEILTLIGAGGMGQVYKARDPRLGRDVAIKVSAAQFSERFEREARSIAALNHPNICHLYDVGPNFLVMELIDGQPLQGPLPVDQALDYARQIADGLRSAHDRGIIHRDLKPANILLTAAGAVKILDFGLAKTSESFASDPKNAPTMTLTETRAGMILGTAAYMSPEQARGKPVDHRTDIWAFGCVLYEMLTGKKAFGGETITDILAAVVTKEPDLTDVPVKTRRLIEHCLEKDPQKRLRDIGDLELLLLEKETQPSFSRKPYVVTTGVAIGFLVIALALVLFLWMRGPSAGPSPVTRFAITLEPNEELTDSPAISPDGRMIAYASQKGSGDPRIYLRDLSAFEAREVVGSSGGSEPFFSPDGKSLGFFAQGQLQKVETSGGAPVKLADGTFPFGGTFLEDGSVVYVPDETSGLVLIRPGRTGPESLTRPDGGENGYSHLWPQALPGGKYVLFAIQGKKRGIALFSMETRKWELVVPGVSAGVAGANAGSTVRVFVSDLNTSVKTATVDIGHPAQVTADRTVLENVNYEIGWRRMALAVSRSGSAVYMTGDPGKKNLVWVDRTGRVAPAVNAPGFFLQSVLSPDGHKVLTLVGPDLWVYELDTGTRHRLTFYGNSGVNASSPVWTLDGSRVIYAANEGVDYDMYSQPSDGSRSGERLLKRPFNQYPNSIAPDGTLLFGEGYPDRGEDLYALLPNGKVEPVRVSRSFSEVNGEFSPNGHRLAYQSDESGRNEIYVEDYPGGSHRVVVSIDGGTVPIWSLDGNELFYVSGDAVMVAPARPDGLFGSARKLFDRSPYDFFWHSYDPAPDGKRLLMVRRDAASIPRQINVIVNWSEELDRLMPSTSYR